MASTPHPDESVEAEAVKVLNELKAGKISIGDILGPLYVKGSDMPNPTINIPPGNKQQPFTAPSVPLAPMSDPNVASCVSHVGPSLAERPNPTPKEKYDLVVIGAGVAGLLSVICAKALGKKAASKGAAVAVADQKDRHRSLSHRESQPNPTSPSRRRRRRVRVL